MDIATFIFALASPSIAIVLSLFARMSDAYIERESRVSSEDYTSTGLDVQESIRDVILRASKGALLIYNCIATCANVLIGGFAVIYYARKII